MRHEIEADSAYGCGGNSEEKERVPYGMSLSSDVNITTCYEHRRHFFQRVAELERCLRLLGGYLLMGGYGDAVRSVAEARAKASVIWDDLITNRVIREGYGHVNLEPRTEPIQCLHKGFCVMGNIGFVDLLDLADFLHFYTEEDGELHPTFRPIEYGTGYITNLNPRTEYLISLFGNENTKRLSLLLIRGCEFFPLVKYFHSADFENLTVLEISASQSLASFPAEAISKLIRLRCLNLSHLPIEMLPPDFFHNLTQLHWLIIRGCSKLRSFPSIDPLTKLEVLDLSHCPSVQATLFLDITYPELRMLNLSYTPVVYGFRELSTPNLIHLSLRGLNLPSLFPLNDPHSLLSLEELDLSNCDHLVSLFPLKNAPRLKYLNMSGCCCFTDLHESRLLDQTPCLVDLDLSWTKVKHLPSFSGLTSLHRLTLRGLELDSLEILATLSNQLLELDLASLKISSSQEFELDFLQSIDKLEILNLSHTSVSKLPHLSKLSSLKELLLADCQQFKVVPNYLQALTNLKTLDLSLPHDCPIHNRQLEMETEGGERTQCFSPVPKSLRKLVLTNRSGVQNIFHKTTLGNLEFLDLRGTDAADWDSKLQEKRPQETIPKAPEIHFIYDGRSKNLPSVDPFEDISVELDALISHIQKNFNSDMAITFTVKPDDQKLLEMIHTDLRYIQENIEMLKSSRSWKSMEDLLQELMDAATFLSSDDFQVDVVNFKQLRRLVVKLKLLVPPKETNDSKALQVTKKKKKSMSVRRKNNENGVDIVKHMKSIVPDLFPSYKSLSDVQKNCLLCFSIFPSNEGGDTNTTIFKSLVIKKKILLYWWVGEGFIDPGENVDSEPIPKENPNPSAWRDEENEHVSTTKGMRKSNTIEEIGEQILKVLVEKGFIEHVIKKGRESGSFCIHPLVHSFVIERAKEEGFFDFDQENGNLIPRFTRSQRACLLKKTQHKFSSSCELWAKHTSSPNKMESFKTVKTLLNINESMIDIKREWFSKMKNLYVLHLGNWGSTNEDLIEVEDQTFLEDLKRMKKLRLLSLHGLPTIMKLPDSVSQLTNLIILDLKECSYLEELPPDIGYLKSLTHLDISNCPLIYKLPKGISLLSKLEVLKGFVITELHGARYSQDRNVSILSRLWEKTKRSTVCGFLHPAKNEVCTFRDLLKLERLRELSLVVDISKFPDDEDLMVLKGMKKLCKLKILWEKNIHTGDKIATDQQTLKGTEESKHLHNIEKLELWCFPNEIAPRWLNPSELKNLTRLHIVGGNLREFQGGTNENEWNVATLRLKYLQNLDIKWDVLKIMFPHLMYLEKHQCDRLVHFPCDEEGVWRSAS